MKYKILVVDDEPANLRMLERLLRDKHDVVTAESGTAAIELLDHHDVALIISDQRMPGMTGIDFLKKAAEIRLHTARIILTGYTDVGDLIEAINSGVVYRYITKPWVNTDLMQTVQRALEHYETLKARHQLAEKNERLETRLRATVQGFVHTVREIAGQKHSNVQEHCRRTSTYAALIAEQLRLDEAEIEQLIFASLLHEVPNMRMPFDMAFFSKTALNPEQLRLTRKNYENGVRLISRIPDLRCVGDILRYQHEHFAGTGFFEGLEGEKIPLMARILAVANAYDEVTHGQNPIHADKSAAKSLRDRAGKDFDPRVVDVCLNIRLQDPADRTASLTAPVPRTEFAAVAHAL